MIKYGQTKIMLKNQAKKLIILIVYSIIFVVFAFFLYAWLWPENKGSCSDGVKNQNEQGVDCGGLCQACIPQPKSGINVISSGFLEAGTADKYDLFGEIENPNADFGIGNFEYVFSLNDSEGSVLATISGTSFILPAEKKYLVENNFESAVRPAGATLEIKNSDWMEFMDYEKPQLKIINKNFSRLSDGSGFGKATGVLRNETPFEFNAVKIGVILKDYTKNVIAVNSTVVNSVRSGENREFQVFWPNRFPGEVGNMDVQAEVNVLDSESFAKKYLDAGEFQKYDYKYR